MTYFIRTEGGAATNVTKADGLAEANRCMMDGKREVAEMTAVSGFYMIWYKDGRKVTLSRQDGDMPEPPAAEDVKEWSGTRTHFNHMHRFGANGRARCNSRIWPQVWHGQNDQGVILHTRAEIEAGEYAHLYTFCPRCEAKES